MVPFGRDVVVIAGGRVTVIVTFTLVEDEATEVTWSVTVEEALRFEGAL